VPASLASVLQVAQQIARRQGGLATSPVEVYPDGDIRLCAAACVGFAALRLADGDAIAQAFRNELASSTNAPILEQTFERFGFGKLLCSLIRIENDRLPPEARLNWFLDLKA
jgi:hypothetical protein